MPIRHRCAKGYKGLFVGLICSWLAWGSLCTLMALNRGLRAVQEDRIMTLQPIKIETIRLYGHLHGVERKSALERLKFLRIRSDNT